MKKTLIHQVWLTLCTIIMAFLMLTTTFNYVISYTEDDTIYASDGSIVQEDESKETISSELSIFCETMEKEEQERQRQNGSIIDWSGKMLETYGIGADARYNSLDFLLDLFERVVSNLRFDVTALVVSPIKNLIAYIICLSVLITSYLTLISCGIGIITSLFSKIVKDPTGDSGITGQAALFAPLLMWGSVEIFRFYNSYNLSDVFQFENTIATTYLSGQNFLHLFIGSMLVYWGGYALIQLFADKILNKFEKKNSQIDQ